METYDIILDDGGELQESNGDFLSGENDNNLIRYLIEANKGEYKEFPLAGLGIELLLNSNKNVQQINREIKKVLTGDVFTSPDIDLSEWPSRISLNRTRVELQ